MQFDLFKTLDTGATFSECERYRYTLWRQWNDGPTVMWLMLNPSTADETDNDSTVERCQRRAVAMGFGRMVVCNIFAYRATDPKDMLAAEDPIGPENDQAILEQARKADQVICAWGNHGHHLGRSAQVIDLLHQAGIHLYCLEITAPGEPKHPLYVGYDVTPKRWTIWKNEKGSLSTAARN